MPQNERTAWDVLDLLHDSLDDDERPKDAFDHFLTTCVLLFKGILILMDILDLTKGEKKPAAQDNHQSQPRRQLAQPRRQTPPRDIQKQLRRRQRLSRGKRPILTGHRYLADKIRRQKELSEAKRQTRVQLLERTQRWRRRARHKPY